MITELTFHRATAAVAISRLLPLFGNQAAASKTERTVDVPHIIINPIQVSDSLVALRYYTVLKTTEKMLSAQELNECWPDIVSGFPVLTNETVVSKD